MGLPLPNFLFLFWKFSLGIVYDDFNIHFLLEYKTKVESEFLGRVLNTIFTLAILFMPIAKGFMTVLPSVHLSSFLIIGVVLSSCLVYRLFMFELILKRDISLLGLQNNSNLSVFPPSRL